MGALPDGERRTCSDRRGGALVLAIALLGLGAALLAGSAAAARATNRSALSFEAGLVADAEARVAIAEGLAQWGGVHDSLPVGAGMLTTLGPRRTRSNAAVAVIHIRLHRLSDAMYVMSVDCGVGPDSAVLARRRLQVLMQRPTQADTTRVPGPPTPIGRWSMSELFL